MKIRIKGNSVRLRLTKPEVDTFKQTGVVAKAINFGSTQMHYKLQVTNSNEQLTADYNNNTITVYMPENLRHDWTTTEWVGYDANMPLPNGESLFILVEKDFKCLDDTTEDQSDMYENPLAHLHK
ncbi:MAG: DUF7009 family protein [Bacteroidia bacterium]